MTRRRRQNSKPYPPRVSQYHPSKPPRQLYSTEYMNPSVSAQQPSAYQAVYPVKPTTPVTNIQHMPSIVQQPYIPPGVSHKENSMNRRWTEKAQLWNSKASGYKEFRYRYGHKSLYCSTCSEFVTKERPYMSVVQHRHSSSKRDRMEACVDPQGNYLCTTCRHTPHSFKVGARYPLILTSSTLNNWQGCRYANNYRGDEFHVEVIGIPGATIDGVDHSLGPAAPRLEVVGWTCLPGAGFTPPGGTVGEEVLYCGS